MSFLKLVESRHSCRHFGEKMIEPEKMDLIYEAIRLAPTAGNLQSYAVRVVTDKEKQNKLATLAGGQMFIAEAPVLLVFLSCPEVSSKKYGTRGQYLYHIQDATIACTYAHLAATDLGLGSCWIGAFDTFAVERCVDADWSWRAIAMLPIGYSSSKSLTSPNKSDKVQVYDSSSNNWCSRQREVHLGREVR